MRFSVTLATLIALSAPAYSESLLDTVKEGAGKVGDAFGKGADVVGETIDSTSELVQDEETPAQTRAKLDAMEAEVLSRLLAENDQAERTLAESAGYAAFDMRQVTIFPLSGGYGRGVAVNEDKTQRTYMQMGTGGVGAAFGIGGFASQFVIMFETPADLQRFVDDGYDASADAGVMDGDERSREEVRFTEGRSIFILDKTGWRVNANAKGTKYWPDEDLN